MRNNKYSHKIKNLIQSGDINNINLAYALGSSQKINVDKLVIDIYGKLLNMFDTRQGLKNKTIQEKVSLLVSSELQLPIKALESIPREIRILQNLSRLNLSYNSLKYVPEEIGDLKNLVVLDLMYNKIEALPKEIGKLENLEVLFLDYNNLNSLPDEIGQLQKLKKFALANNEKLASLPKGIYELKNLDWLCLDNTAISEKEVEKLKLELPNTSIMFNEELPF